MKHKRLYIAAALLLLLSLFLTSCSGKKLSSEIQNGDFSEGSGSSIDGWEQYIYNKETHGTDAAKIELVETNSSGKCVRSVSPFPNDVRLYQEIAVQPNATYRVQFDARYEGIGEGPSAAGLNVSTLEGSGHSEGYYGTVEEWQTITA